MSSFFKILWLCSIFIFTGCTHFIEPKSKITKEETLPNWVNTIDSFYAVGSSSVNFQGVYTQHQEAINRAKSVLAHNLTSYISSILEKKTKTDANSSSRSIYKNSTALSEVFLHQSYQVDAFFDSNKKLYVLIKSSKKQIDTMLKEDALNSKHIELPILKTRAFEQKELLKSRCYAKDILQTIHTKASLYQNRPIWFFRPNENVTMGAVGVAEKQEGIGFKKQKELAIDLAKVSLAKRQSTNIVSSQNLLNIAYENISGKLFETSTIVKTSSKAQASVVSDIWLDPNSCELFVWISVK